MRLLLTYIVSFFLAFNLSQTKAAEVIFDFDNSPDVIEQPVLGALNLPHPVVLRKMLDEAKDSKAGQLLLLGQYFEAKYPDDLIETDFSEDVAQIFPELSKEEIYRQTDKIRTAVKLYRFGKGKYTQIKEDLLTPKDPPLVLPDDEYALLGDQDFIPTEDGMVTIVPDFKKIIGYSKKPRDVEAMEERERRLLDKKNKTSFDQFRTMFSKLEFSKIPEYGVTLPSPFVGNAGIGAWVEDKGFKARLISDQAVISGTEQIVAGVHVQVPAHRFMVATDVADLIQKPSVKLFDMENVKSYEVLYPLPSVLAHDLMIGVYQGDFAFPIKITLQDPKKPVSFKAEFGFEDCDRRFECRHIILKPELEIETAETPAISSVSNFVRQSLYNIPPAASKYFKLDKIKLVPDRVSQTADLYLEFSHKAKVNHFGILLENELHTEFEAPRIISDNDKIYARVKIKNYSEKIKSYSVILTVRLNNYAHFRQEIMLQNLTENSSENNVFLMFMFAFLTGVMFYFSLFGVPLLFERMMKVSAFEPSAEKKYIFYKFLFLLMASIGILGCHNQLLLKYNNLLQNNVYLGMVGVYCLLMYASAHFRILFSNRYMWFKGLLYAGLIILLLPISHAFGLEKVMYDLENFSKYGAYLIGLGLVLGLIVLDILAYFVLKKGLRSKVRYIMFLFSRVLYVAAFLYILLLLFFAVLGTDFLKITFLYIVTYLILIFYFNFWQALYSADLPQSQKNTTEKVLTVLLVLGSFLLPKGFKLPESVKVPPIDEAKIEQTVQSGKNVLLALTTKTCLICRYNDITVFDKDFVKRLDDVQNTQIYALELPELSSQAFDFLKKYNKTSAPLYVFYNAMVPDGIVLSDVLSKQEILDLLADFEP